MLYERTTWKNQQLWDHSSSSMRYLVILQTHFFQNLLARNLIIIAKHNNTKEKKTKCKWIDWNAKNKCRKWAEKSICILCGFPTSLLKLQEQGHQIDWQIHKMFFLWGIQHSWSWLLQEHPVVHLSSADANDNNYADKSLRILLHILVAV